MERRLPGADRLTAEVRQALRSLVRAPWYSTAAIAVIGVSLALATTVFAVVDGVLFRPLPFRDADRILALGGAFSGLPTGPATITLPVSGRDYRAWSDAVPELPIAGLTPTSLELPDGEYVPAALVTENFFEVFGGRPYLGGFRPEEFRRPDPRPALITYEFWQSRFGGDRSAIGQVLPRHTQPGPGIEIVGILPPGFVFPTPPTRRAPSVLLPMIIPRQSGERYVFSFVRAGPEPSAAASLRTRLQAATEEVARAAPPPREVPGLPAEAQRRRGPYDEVVMVPVREYLTSLQRPLFSVVFVMATILGLLASMSVAGLAAARLHDRQAQLAVRRALGARRLDLLRVVIAENLALIVAGAAVGVALTGPFLGVAARRLPETLPLLAVPDLGLRALAFAGLLSAGVMGIVSWWPVRAVTGSRPLQAVAGGAFQTRPDRRTGRRLLVSAQTAATFVLLMGGMLVTVSLLKVWQQDPGFRAARAVVFQVAFGTIVSPERANELAAELRALPGVAGAGAFYASFLQNVAGESPFLPPPGIEAQPIRPTGLMIGGGYLAAAGVRLVEGRLPTDAELDAGTQVLAVSETLARGFFPGRPALGQTLINRRGGQPYVIVGIVSDALYESLDADPSGQLYYTIRNSPNFTRASLFVALRSDEPRELAAVLDAVRAHPGYRPADVRPVEQALADSIRSRRFQALVSSSFAVAAIVVLGTGMLGLVTMTTSRRTREIGVRLTLGATPGQVVKQLILEQARPVVVGLVAGGLVLLWAVRFIEGYLYNVAATDPAWWLLGAGTMLGVTLLGTLLPSLTASRVDPAKALRVE